MSASLRKLSISGRVSRDALLTPLRSSRSGLVRLTERGRRNLDTLLKRVENRRKVIRKALREIKEAHPLNITYESMKNNVNKYKLPLADDEMRMLYDQALFINTRKRGLLAMGEGNMLNLGQTVVSQRSTEDEENLKKPSSAHTDGVLKLLAESFLPKIEKLISSFTNAKYNKIDDPDALYKEANHSMHFLRIPFESHILKRVFFGARTASPLSNAGASVEEKSVNRDFVFEKLKRSLRNQWQELHRSAAVISASGKEDFISFGVISKLFQKHYLGISESEIGEMMQARKSYLEAHGVLDDPNSIPGVGMNLFPQLISACMERQWENILMSFANMKTARTESIAALASSVSNVFGKHDVFLSEREIFFLIQTPDVSAPLKDSINLNDFNEQENLLGGKQNRARRGMTASGVARNFALKRRAQECKRAPIPLPSTIARRQQDVSKGRVKPMTHKRNSDDIKRSLSVPTILNSEPERSSFTLPFIPPLNLKPARDAADAIYGKSKISWRDNSILRLCE